MLSREEKKLVDMVVKAYVSVMGIQKWNSLTGQQQHDVIMILIRDLNNSLS